MMDAEAGRTLLTDYLCTVCVEVPVLVLLLSGRHPAILRWTVGFWLTACTYPIVAGVWPVLIDPRAHPVSFTVAAETFAIVTECLMFRQAFPAPRDDARHDACVIALANLASWAAGCCL